MSTHNNKKSQISTNSADKSCNKNENESHRELDGNLGTRLDSKNVRGQKSIAKFCSDPTCDSNNSKKIDSKSSKAVDMKFKNPLKEFEDAHLEKLRLDLLLRDTKRKTKTCQQCINDKSCESKSINIPPIQIQNSKKGGKMMSDMLLEIDIRMLEEKPLSSSHQESDNTNESLQTDQNAVTESVNNKLFVRIACEQLFYKDDCYRRGQHIYLEGELIRRFPAVIRFIDKDCIWVIKFSDNKGFRVHIDQLIYGEISISPWRLYLAA